MSLDFRVLFARSADGMYVLDQALIVVEANDAFLALVGRDRESVIGRVVTDLVQGEDLAMHPPQLATLAHEGSALTMRRFQRPDGTLVEAEISISLLGGGRMFCVARDVRRRPAVSALRDSEARFRGVAENLNAGLVVTDLEHRAVYVNDRMCELTGYARAELEGRPLASLLFADDEQAAHAQRLTRRLAGTRERYEVRHRRKDGSVFLGEVSAAPLHDGEGRPVGTVGIVIDVTGRDEWERELADREHRYRLLFEVTPLPAWVYDTETYRFLAVNPAAVAHYGYSVTEFLGMSIYDIRPPEEYERLAAALQSLRDGGGPERGRALGYRHRKKDGTLIDVEVISHAFDFAGRAARIVVVNDVTESLRLRRREHEVQQQLLNVQKMEAVGRLAGGVAHDFNNLLSVVLSATEVLWDDLPADSPHRADLQDIRDAAERGAALTRQLLAFGRKDVHAPQLIDVHDVVRNVERLLARALGGGVRLEIRRESAACRVMADASQLEQVLVNLAINARDAMPLGGSLVITTGRRWLDEPAAGDAELLPGQYVALEVSDTGTGMDETTRLRAFDPFYTTKGPLEGTGLGLSTVYGIVRQSGGAVSLASAPGHGTRVTILLPAIGGPDGMEAPDGRGDVRAPLSVQPARRVLLVEDEPRVRVQARRVLERCGFEVLDAGDGAEGLRQFLAHRGLLDAIVTDVVMPVMGGVEMVAEVRAREPGMPVVFVSGFTARDRDLPLDERTTFVPKPYTMAALQAAVEAVIARR